MLNLSDISSDSEDNVFKLKENDVSEDDSMFKIEQKLLKEKYDSQQLEKSQKSSTLHRMSSIKLINDSDVTKGLKYDYSLSKKPKLLWTQLLFSSNYSNNPFVSAQVYSKNKKFRFSLIYYEIYLTHPEIGPKNND